MARLVVVSNRVAVPGEDRAARAGGLAIAVKAAFKRHPGLWFGWSGHVAERDDVRTRSIVDGDQSYVLTDLTQDDYQEYYNGFANRVLWPLLHYRLDLAEFSRRDLSGYVRVNEHFADGLHDLLRPDDLVWVHDYHLIPLAGALRRRGHHNRIGFFLHIPWPPPEIMSTLPNQERLIRDLCQYELIGFQTDRDAANFTRYLWHELKLPSRDHDTFSVEGRTVRVLSFPVGIATESFARQARRAIRSSFVQKMINSLSGRALIIGVDRLDYTKGLTLRMDAFEKFLVAQPEWRGKVTYLQITPKSRSDIPEYNDMERAVGATAGRINGAYGEVDWTPIRYVNRAYSHTALAGLYRASRAALVTPLRDGMNLVAKEYVAAQDPEDPGVLILSRFAGAALECEAALLVNPYDPEGVAAAIARALSMPLDERRARHAAIYRVLAANNIDRWAEEFLSELSHPKVAMSWFDRPARTARP